MRYFELTDPLRGGEIIRTDGRKHYRFVFGPYQWERTTAFQAYITEGTEVTGQYRPISEEQAQKLLLERGKQLSALLKKADQIAQEAHKDQVDKAGKPYIAHPRAVAEMLEDWEEKIAALLHDVCEDTSWTIDRLRAAGFPERICQTVDLLTRPAGVSYGDYLKRLRDSRMARNVKLADLAHNMDLRRLPEPGPEDYARVEKYRKARQYLFGDISDFSEEVDERSAEKSVKRMTPAMEVYQRLRPLALGGRKIPHGVSNPVLRVRNGKLCLAFFVYTYNRADLQKGEISRPVSWMTADLTDGRLLEEIPCGEEDFSSAPPQERFSTENPSGMPPADFFPRVYALLDAVRQTYLDTGALPQADYGQYLSEILQAVPPAYHRFYRELSKL